MLTKQKPLFVDEVGTTAIRYDEQFSRAKSQEMITRANQSKNEWLRDLADFVDQHSEIVGMNYFNIDYTNGLRDRSMGEADRKMIDPEKGILYQGAQNILDKNNTSHVASLFQQPPKKQTLDLDAKKG